MGKARKHATERLVNILRQIEAAVVNGKTHPMANRERQPWLSRTTVVCPWCDPLLRRRQRAVADVDCFLNISALFNQLLKRLSLIKE